MEPQTPAENSLLQQQGLRLLEAVRPLAQRADAINGKVRTLGVLTLVAAGWLWGLLFYPFVLETWWGWALAVLLLILLLLPGGILLLFYAGLNQLIDVPNQLVALLGEGETQGSTLVTSAVGKRERGLRRLWSFLKSLLDLRGVLLDGKGLLLQYAVVVRLVNPWTAGSVLVAAIVGVILIGLAAVSSLIVLIF